MKYINRFLQIYQAQHRYLGYKVQVFLAANWQKLAFLILLLLVFSYKNLTIYFDLSAPFGAAAMPPKIEETLPKNPDAVQRGFTENVQESSRTETFSFFPMLFGKKGKDAPQTLEAQFKTLRKSKVERYVKRYAHLAVEEMQHFQIPASVTLAQALLHGQGGEGDLAQKHHNHFSITCGSAWQNETCELQGICYRAYPSAWLSFRDHSKLITSGRFADLRQNSSTDYKKWALGLQEKSYSVEPNYAELLVQIIKDFNLDRFDE